jgi:hypothetical protein
MTDPRLSEHTNEVLTDELREVIGSSSVQVPADRPHVHQDERPLRAGPTLSVTNNRLMIITIASMFLVLGAIVALTTGDWWLLPLAAILLGGLTMMLVRAVLRMTAVREHASPSTTAAMQAEGIQNPDEYFSAAVAEFSETTDDDVSEDRTTSVQENPDQAGAEQQAAGTQTSGRSRSVG